jgi:hypothetical protein
MKSRRPVRRCPGRTPSAWSTFISMAMKAMKARVPPFLSLPMIFRDSVRPLKWLRFVMFAVCGARGDLSVTPGAPLFYMTVSPTQTSQNPIIILLRVSFLDFRIPYLPRANYDPMLYRGLSSHRLQGIKRSNNVFCANDTPQSFPCRSCGARRLILSFYEGASACLQRSTHHPQKQGR